MGLLDFFKKKISLPVSKKQNKEPLKGLRSHTVKRGDTLQKLSKQYYGDAAAWERIYDANYGVITDPRKIYIGQQIIIP
ncbi:MAG: LysM peptidoglycan-binding domain-containing protein [Cyclobacteriaceae bacterium]|nr:LysM peptidoglycan-binding domain-containing protein [Cyclobacteriaceae bacterium]